VSRREIRTGLIGVLAGLAVGMLNVVPDASAGTGSARCPGWGRPALALLKSSPASRHALRVFAIQFAQRPASMATAAVYARAVDCAFDTEVVPHLARGRPNVVVFDEDVGLESIAIGPRGAAARSLLAHGDPSCTSGPPCQTLATLNVLDGGYARALSYLGKRFPALDSQLGRGFVAATDEFARVFMTTMAQAARRYGVYVIASNTQAPFAVTRDPAAVAALSDPGLPKPKAVYAPTQGVAYDQTFVWGPRVLHRGRPAPLANLLADNDKVPLTSFESALGFGTGPTGGAAARRNLRPITIPGTGARLGIATSLPAFAYGPADTRHPCADVTVSYVRCLNALGANVLIQADANDGAWTGSAGAEPWQPLAWMGSAYRAVSDPTVRFAYAVNPFMVGNLSDTPFDGQSAILQRGLRGPGCAYVGDRTFLAGQDLAADRRYAGSKPQFLAIAPWATPDGPRAKLTRVGAALAAGTGPARYVQTALVADLPFPAVRARRGCVEAGR
jgi:hypothetical protein